VCLVNRRSSRGCGSNWRASAFAAHASTWRDISTAGVGPRRKRGAGLRPAARLNFSPHEGTSNFACRIVVLSPGRVLMQLLSMILGPTLVLFITCFIARAAEDGLRVSGKIVDENGLAVAFARVELRRGPSSPALAVTSDIAGGFWLQLAPGQ